MFRCDYQETDLSTDRLRELLEHNKHLAKVLKCSPLAAKRHVDTAAALTDLTKVRRAIIYEITEDGIRIGETLYVFPRDDD